MRNGRELIVGGLVVALMVAVCAAAPVAKVSETANNEKKGQSSSAAIVSKSDNRVDAKKFPALSAPAVAPPMPKSPEVADAPQEKLLQTHTAQSPAIPSLPLQAIKSLSGPPAAQAQAARGPGTQQAAPREGEAKEGSDEEREGEEEERGQGEAGLVDADLYLQALLSDPSLVQEILAEEQNIQREQEQEQERAERSAYDLKPLAMAEYLLATGDLEGVERMTNDLVVYGALTMQEARAYRKAVEEAYNILTSVPDQANFNYGPQSRLDAERSSADDVTFSEASRSGAPAEYELGGTSNIEGGYYPSSNPSGSEYDATERAEEMAPYYDDILRELLGTMTADDSAGASESEALSPANEAGAPASDSLEEELEDLPHRAPSTNQNEEDDETAEEEQLELLTKTSSASKTKQIQDNRTKPRQSATSGRSSQDKTEVLSEAKH